MLDDENKTAVVSQRGMGEAIGLGEGGSRLPKFIQGKTISQFIGRELREKLENPLIFQYQQVGTNNPVNPVVHGYDITEVWEYKKQTRYTVKVDPKEGSTAKPKFYYPRTSALQKVS